MNSGIQSVLPTSGDNFWEENWSELFLLKVYIIVCYFSLIIFSTVELTLFVTGFPRAVLANTVNVLKF